LGGEDQVLHIPFNRPFLSGREFEFIQQAIAGSKISGDGTFTRKCHARLESELGIHKALLATSCTHALDMAALLLDIKPGDEVVIPSFTFVSTVNAFVLRGARPVFIDIRPDTLNLDESQLEGLITSRTRAIVVVHYAGVACDMDTILQVAERHAIPVVEDNAHGLFGKYKGRYLGTLGCLATQSFHETKNFTCGEGGALLINDPQYVERAEIIREKGTDRSRFFRGQVEKYTWMDVGSSYLPSDILAAFLYAQLEARDNIQARRQRIWEYYNEHLREWAENFDVQLPSVPSYCEQSFHMYYLVLPTPELRRRLLTHLNACDINSVFHYQPLHLSRMGQTFGGKEGQCPVAEDVSERLLRLPFYTGLSEADQLRVVSALIDFTAGEAWVPLDSLAV
jgi:dTDP-4-amino-4,6-dideoxygalactose transaminase